MKGFSQEVFEELAIYKEKKGVIIKRFEKGKKYFKETTLSLYYLL